MAKTVICRFVRNDNKTFRVDNRNYFIPSEDGLVGLDLNNWTLESKSLAFRDGGIITGGRYDAKPIQVKFYSKTNDDVEREKIRAFFIPKKKYKLYITYRGITRWIEGQLEIMSEPAENAFKKIECTVGLLCEDPFFKSEIGINRDLKEIIPMWGFPYMSSADNPSVFSRYTSTQYMWFDNKGDMDINFNVKMYFTADVSNPIIYQGYTDQNKFFKLNGTFHSTDIILINFDTLSITKNGTRAWNLVSYDSIALKIPVGGTYLSVNSSTGVENIHCVVSYYEHFVGM